VRSHEAAEAKPSPTAAGVRLQRKCACGQHTIAGGECDACRAAAGLRRSPLRVQRLAAEGAPPQTEPTTEGRIVEDEAGSAGPGSMRKSDFLSELRMSLEATVEMELTEPDQARQARKYIGDWLDEYAAQDAASLERSLQRYAPETSGAASARDYIPAVRERIRRSMVTWRTTGQITGLPEEIAGRLPGAGLSGIFKGLASGLGGLFFKSPGGNARDAGDPAAIQSRLGRGESLSGATRSRMESAFGHDFSRVRLHHDSAAGQLAGSLNARAFTIGQDVAFAGGEYQPGTPVGDALLAHELAHVVQQSGAQAPAQPMTKGSLESGALEEEADNAAVGVVASLWGGFKGRMADLRENALPRMKSGLRLQRCGAPDTNARTRYEQLLLEGNEKLKGIGFGLPWNHEFCTSHKINPETGSRGFDEDFWVRPEDECKLVVRRDRKPADAIEALFDPARKKKWLVDCSQFVQLAHFYALLHTEGKEALNARMGSDFELKGLASQGLKTRSLWIRNDRNAKMGEAEVAASGSGAVFDKDRAPVLKKDGREKDVKEVLAAAPFGSRVVFTNGFPIGIGAHTGAFRNENTMKVGKDAFAAHPLTRGGLSSSNIFTAEEIGDEMAKAAAEYAEAARPYVFISEIEYYERPD
jgi:hypothetical protein